MTDDADGPSLRKRTVAIRHLDAARAREIVALFDRPVVDRGTGPAFDASDPITAATQGCLTLDQAGSGLGSADVVGHYQTHLYLDAVLRLPPSVARELARHRGHLYLDGLRSITDTTAAALAAHATGGLSLRGLRQLSPAAAAALGRHRGELSLDRLARLDDKAALGLAAHAHDLFLGGLETLSPQAAAALARHRGDLILGSLARAPGRVAAHLARHGGKLHLHGVTALSTAAAQAFGGRNGFLCLKGLRRLAPRQARLLAGHTGELQLHKLELDEATAFFLGQHAGSLLLHVRDDIPLSQLEALVQHRGPLELPGLVRLDERRAAALAAQPGPGGIRGLAGLFLNDVTRITPAVAAILADHGAGGLSLNGLESLSADVARELVRHPLLALDHVASITDGVAAILATHEGTTLSLRGLRTASRAALARLRDNPGIELPRRLMPQAGVTPARPASAPHPTREQLVRAIERIAAEGEAALRA